MIAHEAIGEDPVATEVLLHSHKGAEFFFLIWAEDQTPVDDAGDAVVDGWFFAFGMVRDDPAEWAHGVMVGGVLGGDKLKRV